MHGNNCSGIDFRRILNHRSKHIRIRSHRNLNWNLSQSSIERSIDFSVRSIPNRRLLVNLHMSIQLKMTFKLSATNGADMRLSFMRLGMLSNLGQVLNRLAFPTRAIIENHVLRVHPHTNISSIEVTSIKFLEEFEFRHGGRSFTLSSQ